MTGVRGVALVLGAAFGAVLAWTQMTDPDRIRAMLLLEDLYLFLVMFSSMAVAFTALRLLRTLRLRSLVTREPLAWTSGRPERRHVAGSVLFGAGWGVSLSCPGPIAAQLGQGIYWSLATIGGIAVGIALHLAYQRRATATRVVAPPAASPGRALGAVAANMMKDFIPLPGRKIGETDREPAGRRRSARPGARP